MLVGVVTVLLISEPDVHPDRATLEQEAKVEAVLGHQVWLPETARRFMAWFSDAVVSPFVDFSGVIDGRLYCY